MASPGGASWPLPGSWGQAAVAAWSAAVCKWGVLHHCEDCFTISPALLLVPGCRVPAFKQNMSARPEHGLSWTNTQLSIATSMTSAFWDYCACKHVGFHEVKHPVGFEGRLISRKVFSLIPQTSAVRDLHPGRFPHSAPRLSLAAIPVALWALARQGSFMVVAGKHFTFSGTSPLNC